MRLAERVSTANNDDQPALGRRRRFLRRLSPGHWLMLLAGLLAALVNFAALRSTDSSVPVVVAAVDLQAGEIIAPEAVAVTEIAADDEIVAALVSGHEVDAVVGSIAASAITAGDLVVRSALRPAADLSGLRTMSVPIDPALAVGGSLDRGDRIDVIVVDDGAATYLAADVGVVAVAERGGSGALGAVGAYHVTIAVDAEIALHMAAALRSADVVIVRSTGSEPLSEEQLLMRVGGIEDEEETMEGEADLRLIESAP